MTTSLERPLSSKGAEGTFEGRALEVPHDLTTPLDAHRQEGPDPTLIFAAGKPPRCEAEKANPPPMVSRLARGIPSSEHVDARLETGAKNLGFETPSTDLHLSALSVDGVWILYLWSVEQNQTQLEGWLEAHVDFQPRLDQTTDHVYAAQTQHLPPTLEDLFGRFDVQSVILRADGSATISIHAAREQVQSLIKSLDATLLQISNASQGADDPRTNPLTEAERKTLIAAYEAGYFDIPRRLRQSELAEELGKSTGALSTILRRATQKLIEHHIRDAARRPVVGGPHGHEIDPSSQPPSSPNR